MTRRQATVAHLAQQVRLLSSDLSSHNAHAEFSTKCSSLATLLYDSTTSYVHDAASYVVGVPQKEAPVSSQSLIFLTGTGGGESRR